MPGLSMAAAGWAKAAAAGVVVEEERTS